MSLGDLSEQDYLIITGVAVLSSWCDYDTKLRGCLKLGYFVVTLCLINNKDYSVLKIHYSHGPGICNIF